MQHTYKSIMQRALPHSNQMLTRSFSARKEPNTGNMIGIIAPDTQTSDRIMSLVSSTLKKEIFCDLRFLGFGVTPLECNKLSEATLTKKIYHNPDFKEEISTIYINQLGKTYYDLVSNHISDGLHSVLFVKELQKNLKNKEPFVEKLGLNRPRELNLRKMLDSWEKVTKKLSPSASLTIPFSSSEFVQACSFVPSYFNFIIDNNSKLDMEAFNALYQDNFENRQKIRKQFAYVGSKLINSELSHINQSANFTIADIKNLVLSVPSPSEILNPTLIINANTSLTEKKKQFIAKHSQKMLTSDNISSDKIDFDFAQQLLFESEAFPKVNNILQKGVFLNIHTIDNIMQRETLKRLATMGTPVINITTPSTLSDQELKDKLKEELEKQRKNLTRALAPDEV